MNCNIKVDIFATQVLAEYPNTSSLNPKCICDRDEAFYVARGLSIDEFDSVVSALYQLRQNKCTFK